MAQSNSSLMAGIPELLILRLLANQERYGYELARDIRLVTSEAISLGEGVLYPALHSLERRGLLRSRRHKVDGRVRVYYRITPSGTRRLRQLGKDWQRIMAGVESALGEGHHG